MPTTCTCGATLPEDARFCHRCGKPQFEELPTRRETPVAEHPPVSAASGISFSDPIALRTAMVVAIVTTLLDLTPLLLIAPLIGGFLAVMFYARRTGRRLTPGEGAKLGWITGLINVLLGTVFITLSMAMNGTTLVTTIRELAKTKNLPAEQAQYLSSTGGLVGIVLFMWIFFFLFSTLLHMAGGALGAKLNARSR